MKIKQCNNTNKYVETRIDTVNTFCKFWFQHLAVLQTVLRGGNQRSGFVASFVCAQRNGVRNVAPRQSAEFRTVSGIQI